MDQTARKPTPSPRPGAAEPSDPTSAAREPELVARAATDPDAFAALYRRHYPAIARYVRRRTGDADAAGDLVAETFVVALEKIGRYRERGLPFRAWLYRLATSRVNRWARRRSRRATRSIEEEPCAHAEEDRGEAVALARSALQSLPPRYQSTLVLHYLEGLSVEETAAALGCRPGTVKARLSRGRDRLRRRLEPFAEELFR